jgi:hypothetical protein
VHWALYEYDVAVGDSRTIYTRNKTTEPQNISIDEGCTPDTYGEHWYCVTTLGLYDGGMPVATAQLLSSDGVSRDIPIDFHLKEAVGGEWFFIESDGYDFGCGAGCEIRLFSVEGERLNTFRLTKAAVPEKVVFNLYVSEVADSERLIPQMTLLAARFTCCRLMAALAFWNYSVLSQYPSIS